MFFDNLQVTHVRGPLLEESHYYPFGLTMSGISGKASSFGQPGNKYKYNGIEFDEDLGINSYEAFYRELDPSIGRWWQIDPKIENQEMWSPYSSMSNDPVRYKDPLGDEPDGGTDGILSVAKTALGTISGLVVGTLDNLTGGQLRLAVSNNISDPQIANGWNKGLDGADAGAFLIGNGESGTGLAVATSSVYVTAGTGGATIVVSGPTALLGGALALHGQMVKANGLNNLGTQSGRVDASKMHGGGKNSQHLNQKARESAKERYQSVKEKYEQLKSKPNKTKEDKEALNKTEKAMKHEKQKMDNATGIKNKRLILYPLLTCLKKFL
jgi:RHS repeat-associated protein